MMIARCVVARNNFPVSPAASISRSCGLRGIWSRRENIEKSAGIITFPNLQEHAGMPKNADPMELIAKQTAMKAMSDPNRGQAFLSLLVLCAILIDSLLPAREFIGRYITAHGRRETRL